MQQQSELRNRVVTGTAPRVVVAENEPSSPESGQTLTPSSSEDQDQPDVPRTNSSASTRWQNLRGRLSMSSASISQIENSPQYLESCNRMKKQRKVEEYPEGWPQLAAFINSDETYEVWRRFRKLRGRTLLHQQNTLTELERELDELDEKDAADPNLEYRLRGWEGYPGDDGAKKELLSKIGAALREYDQTLLAHLVLMDRAKASENQHRSLFNWICTENPLGKDDFIYHMDDFISAASNENNNNWVKNKIESWSANWPSWILKLLFQTEAERQKTNNAFVIHYSDFRLKSFATFLVASGSVGMLLTPVFLLFLAELSRKSMACVVAVFLFASSAVFSSTGASVQAVFGYTAAYCAVLITFLGNIQGNAIASGGK